MFSFWQRLAIWCWANSFPIYKISTLALYSFKVFWSYEPVLFYLSFVVCAKPFGGGGAKVSCSFWKVSAAFWTYGKWQQSHLFVQGQLVGLANMAVRCLALFLPFTHSTLLPISFDKISFDKIYNNHRNRYLISHMWIKVYTV